MKAETLYEMLADAKRPRDLVSILENLIDKNIYMLSDVRVNDERLFGKGANKMSLLRLVARLVLRYLNLLPVRRREYYISKMLSAAANLGTLLRLTFLLRRPEEWEWLYNTLDDEGKNALMNWLRMHIAVLAYPSYTDSINRFAETSLEDFWEKSEKLNIHVRTARLGNCGVYNIIRVKGRRAIYKLYATGVEEVVAVWFYRKLLEPPPGIVVDGGAFLGETSVWLADVQPEARVLAFEPEPCNSKVLERVVRENKLEDRISVRREALWDRDSSIRLLPARDASRVADEGVEVRAVRLDTVREELGERISYIKLDIEGAEPNALKGGFETLRRDKPVVLASAYHQPRDPIILARLLHEAGYERISFRVPLPSLGEAMVIGLR